MDADAVAEEADGEEEGAEPRDEFHSLRHVMPYAREAARAIDCAQEAAERGQRRRRLGSTAAVMQRWSRPSNPPALPSKLRCTQHQLVCLPVIRCTCSFCTLPGCSRCHMQGMTIE